MPTPIFNEYTLRQEIIDKWGLYGAHAEVYDTLLTKLSEASAALRKIVSISDDPSADALTTELKMRSIAIEATKNLDK